jgi:flagellin
VAITGDFATPAALGSAITAALPGVDVIVNETTGVAELRASASFAVSGTQADPSGALAFKRLSSEAQGSLADVNVLDFKKATESLLRVDAALNTVNTSRANLGAMQNRFGAIVDNLQIGAESSAAARSRIMDTDYSAETGNLTRFKILLQASMAMVAQANASQSLVLRLLRT